MMDVMDAVRNGGYAECPECSERLPDINSEDMALKFLKGEIEPVFDSFGRVMLDKEIDILYAGMEWNRIKGTDYWIEVKWENKKEVKK